MSAVEEMQRLLDELYESFNTGDPSVWRSHLADDVVAVGTDPDEYLEGSGPFTEAIIAQMEEMSEADMEMTGGEPHIVEHGDVVWAIDHPVMHLADGTDVPMRSTVIAIHEPEGLRIRHTHYSIGTPDEEIFEEAFTE